MTVKKKNKTKRKQQKRSYIHEKIRNIFQELRVLYPELFGYTGIYSYCILEWN